MTFSINFSELRDGNGTLITEKVVSDLTWKPAIKPPEPGTKLTIDLPEVGKAEYKFLEASPPDRLGWATWRLEKL